MPQTPHTLIAMLQSTGWHTQEEALLYIGLLLEMHTFHAQNQAQYITLLPKDIQEIVLSEADQAMLVQALVDVIGPNNQRIQGALQSIRMAAPKIAFTPLVKLVRNKQGYFDAESKKQVLIALERYLRHAIQENTMPYTYQLMQTYDTFDWLQNQLTSQEPDIQELAQRIINIINASS